jgi:hypothetical protein
MNNNKIFILIEDKFVCIRLGSLFYIKTDETGSAFISLSRIIRLRFNYK